MPLPLLLAAAVAAAPAAEVRGTIVALEGPDVFVDVGAEAGLRKGDELVVFRVVEARHPRSGEALRDRFPIGTVPVAEAGRVLSLARPPPALAAKLSVGDEVSFVPRAAEAVPPDGALALAPLRDDLGPVAEAWSRHLGRPPRERAVGWQAFLAAHPSSPLAGVIRREIEALHLEADALDRALSGVAPVLADVQGGAPSRVLAGQEVEVALALPDGAGIEEARVHYRPAGAAGYAWAALEPDGDGYLRAKLPRDVVAEPGLDWFASGVDAAGRERPLLGSGDAPQGLVVAPDPSAPPLREGRSRVAMSYEHVSFDGAYGDDRYSLLEGDFLYRVLHPALYSLKLGFGVFQGRGGSDEELDRGASREVGLHYGSAELELELAGSFALIGRGLAGNSSEGFASGFEAKARLGAERGTSLVLGASTTEGIGDAGSLQLNWDTVPGFPMGGTVVVTNMPVGEDVRVRLVYEVRRELSDVFGVALRASYGARDADHGGVGLGLGTVFAW